MTVEGETKTPEFYLYKSSQRLCASGLKITKEQIERMIDMSELGATQQSRNKSVKEKIITKEEKESYYKEIAR